MRIDFKHVGGKNTPRGGKLTLINLKVTDAELVEYKNIAELCKKELRVAVTRSFILREGARLFMKQLQRELQKAKNGELHAKKRKHESYQKEEDKFVLRPGEGRVVGAKRRRRQLGDYRSVAVQLAR